MTLAYTLVAMEADLVEVVMAMEVRFRILGRVPRRMGS